MEEIRGPQPKQPGALPPRLAVPASPPTSSPSPANASQEAAADRMVVKAQGLGASAQPQGMDGLSLPSSALMGVKDMGLKWDGPPLARHDAGPEVLALQVALNGAGVRLEGRAIAEDRRFGAQTEAGLCQFQQAMQMTPNGIADPNSKLALEAANRLILAERALEHGSAEQAMIAKQLVDQAQRFLASLPPHLAKPLREQAIQNQKRLEKAKARPHFFEEAPPPIVAALLPDEAALAEQERLERAQHAADLASTQALRQALRANTDAQWALAQAKQSLLNAQAALSLEALAQAQDQFNLALDKAHAALLLVQDSVASLDAVLLDAPNPEAFAAKKQKAQQLEARVRQCQDNTAGHQEAMQQVFLAQGDAISEGQSQALVALRLQEGLLELAEAQMSHALQRGFEEAQGSGGMVNSPPID